MRIYKFSQNMNYLVNSLGVNLKISEVILPYLQSMKKIKRSYILRKIKENIELINNSNQLLSNASYLDVLFPFKDKEVKFPDYINKVTDNIEERKFPSQLESLFCSKQPSENSFYIGEFPHFSILCQP